MPLGLELGHLGLALLDGECVAMAAFRRGRSLGLGLHAKGGAGQAEGGQGDHDVLADGVHCVSFSEFSLDVQLNCSLHRTHLRQNL